MEDKIKHLEFIQNIINRMNANSFQLKGLLITIISAILAIYASTLNNSILYIGFFPAIIFWFLDTYYLQQERKFRGVYENVCGSKDDIMIKPFEMPIHKFTAGKYNYWAVFSSKTISWFYSATVIILLIVIIVLTVTSK